jgi:hypothetical protein
MPALVFLEAAPQNDVNFFPGFDHGHGRVLGKFRGLSGVHDGPAVVGKLRESTINHVTKARKSHQPASSDGKFLPLQRHGATDM